MIDDDRLVSDAERDAVVKSLREHLGAGRLTLDEFSQRVDLAYGSRDTHQLAQAHLGLESANGLSRTPRGRAIWLTAAVFSHVVRRGQLRLGRVALTASLLSDIDLDLRLAELTSGRSTLVMWALFGNIDLYLPDDIDVSVHSLAVFGHCRDWGRSDVYVNGQSINVSVFSVFGTVDVWRIPKTMKGDYGKLIKKLRRAQKQLRH